MTEDPTIITQIMAKLGEGVVVMHSMKVYEAMEV
jgi:hypothetical protein